MSEAENKRIVELLVEVLNQACEYEEMMEVKVKGLEEENKQLKTEAEAHKAMMQDVNEYVDEERNIKLKALKILNDLSDFRVNDLKIVFDEIERGCYKSQSELFRAIIDCFDEKMDWKHLRVVLALIGSPSVTSEGKEEAQKK